MATSIPLTQGQVAIVDDADAPLVAQHHWWASRGAYSYYAVTKVRLSRGRWRLLGMHRFLMGDPPGLQVDHVNHDGLDNRRSNLRIATQSQNKANSRRYRQNASGFKGVYRRAHYDRWSAQIAYGGRLRHLGYFNSPEEAARAYDTKARELFGAFALCNLPDD